MAFEPEICLVDEGDILDLSYHVVQHLYSMYKKIEVTKKSNRIKVPLHIWGQKTIAT